MSLMFINSESLSAIGDKIREVLGEAATYKFSVPTGLVNSIMQCNSVGKDAMIAKNFTTYDVRYESYRKNAGYGPYAFAGNDKLRSAALSSLKELPDYCFLDCTSLEDVGWYNASGVRTYKTVQGKGAFKGCTSLKNITLAGSPLTPTTIADEAFSGCTALERVIFSGTPNTYTRIGKEAFLDCSAMTSFSFGGYLNTIGDSAFARSGLTSVNLTMNNGTRLTIGQYAFSDCPDLETASISVASGKQIVLNPYCFSNDIALTTVTFSEGLTSIPDHCFDGCSSLTSIHIPASVTSIGEYAFNGCTSLSEVVFDGTPTITSIGQRAFMNCDSLVNFTVPASVTSIGAYAFADCDSLEYTRLLPITPPTAGQYLFYTTINNPMTIYVPASVDNVVYNAYYNATNWKISSYRSRMAIWPES